MHQLNKHTLHCIEQACEDSKKLHDVWSLNGKDTLFFTDIHLKEVKRVSHRIAGSCLTFGLENIASIARVCEMATSELLSQEIETGNYISPVHVERIESLIYNLYNACVQTRTQYYDENEASPSQANSDSEKNSHSLNGYSVLVVDDDPVMRIFVQRKLEKRGFEIFTAENGLEAIETAQNVKPDIILMDGLMPDMDGFEALAKIRENKEVGNTKVFMLTALADQENIADGMVNGADDYIIKPFNVDELIDKIYTHLNA